MTKDLSNLTTAYLAGGCFWGLEDLFRDLEGVMDTEVGYSGGLSNKPTYENHLGHAETLAITYNPDKISYAEILDFYFRIHDPTTLNRQGNDVGSSYRSAIFYRDQTELKIAETVIARVNASGLYPNPVVTSLEEFKAFYPAESYHQDYLRKHPGGYTCHYLRSDKPLA